MRTDKQLFKIFAAVPEWLFELAGLPSPGASRLESFTVKALERVADGLVVPKAPDQPLTVVEFQFQSDDRIYLRMVVEMVAVQEAHPGRSVQGVIFFGYNGLDPRTEPWRRVVHSCVLEEALESWARSRPLHPLVATFKPLLAENDEVLEHEAADCYRAIKYSELSASCKRALEEVFLNWLGQRLKYKDRKEIEAMLLGELPDLEETQLGKDLIRIGEQRGLQTGLEQGLEKGLEKAIRAFVAARFGAVPAAIEAKILSLSVAEAEGLIPFLPHCQSLEELARRLGVESHN